MKTEKDYLIDELREQYRDVRELPDGSIACLYDLLTTRAILTGANREGWARRFCFKDRELATKRFAELETEDDVPEGFIARRGR